jgi:hypothetical protein
MARKLLPLLWLEGLRQYEQGARHPEERSDKGSWDSRIGTEIAKSASGCAQEPQSLGPKILRRFGPQDDEAISSSSVFQNRGYDFETTCSLAIATPPRARPAMAKLMARR